MKGLVYKQHNGFSGLMVEEIPKPSPKEDEVLVRVKASSLNIVDYEPFRRPAGRPEFFSKMVGSLQNGKVLGGECSGIIEAIGKNVFHLSVGDEVYGKTPGVIGTGAWAEYAVMKSGQVERKPATLSFEEAASIPVAGEVALGGVRKAHIQPGRQVMIYWASGGVGQYAVQFAKAQGATVTGVCSTRNQELAWALGCDDVIDYKKDDFRKVGQKFDSIIGVNGCNPISHYKKLLKANGTFVCIGNGKQAMHALVLSLFSKKIKTSALPLEPIKDCLAYAQKLAEAGQLKPHIDKVYPVQEAQSAIEYVLEQHVQGKVVLRMEF